MMDTAWNMQIKVEAQAFSPSSFESGILMSIPFRMNSYCRCFTVLILPSDVYSAEKSGTEGKTFETLVILRFGRNCFPLPNKSGVNFSQIKI